MNIVNKTEALLVQRFQSHPSDGSTIDQVMTDLAVIVLSNMRPAEIEQALVFSIGHEGVSKLFGGSNG